MYRVLIVDDEEPVLDSYEFMLKTTAVFTLSGKARSSYEALKLIHEQEPDLVFIDINIPGIDGLEVIADVHKKFPAMVFILSTAYERFDLAQRAIPLGVFAYLVKPVAKKTFLDILDQVHEALDARSPGSAAEEETVAQFLRKTIWQEADDATWMHRRQRFSFPSDKGMVFMLEIDDDPETISDVIANKLSLKYHCIHDTKMNRSLFLVSGEVNRDVLEAQLKALLHEQPENTVYYGIGSLRRGRELFLSCTEALEFLLRQRNATDALEREKQNQRRCLARLRRSIDRSDSDEARKLFAAYWHGVFRGDDFTLGKAKMAALFTLLLDDCTGYYRDNVFNNNKASGDAEEPPFDPVEEIMSLVDMAAWEAWAGIAFEKIFLWGNIHRGAYFPLPLSRAIDFIQQHYTEAIQLSAVATAASVSPAYLSRLFSEYLKTSFVDYVTDLRIKWAEKLISETQMSIKEIAFASGFQDPAYFSKIFRKATGMSPGDYGRTKNKG